MAQAFRGNPWLIGYDPFNEPFSTSLVHYRGEHFNAQIQCFYTGTKYIRITGCGCAGIALSTQ